MTKLANFYFRSVCIKLVALRMNLYQEVVLSFRKVGYPWCRDWGTIGPQVNIPLNRGRREIFRPSWKNVL